MEEQHRVDMEDRYRKVDMVLHMMKNKVGSTEAMVSVA